MSTQVTQDEIATASLGYTEDTTQRAYTPSAGVYFDLTGLTVTVTVPNNGRKITVEGFLGGADCTVGAPCLFDFAIVEGSTVLNETQHQIQAGVRNTMYVKHTFTPTAGSHTYKLQLKVNQVSSTVSTYISGNMRNSIEVTLK